MQWEKMDDRIRDAAERHHPTYNEEAWPAMEKLLNKHLPQEKDDRRRLLWLWFLLPLLGGALWLGWAKPWRHGNKPLAVQSGGKAVTPVNAESTGNTTKTDNTPITGQTAVVKVESPQPVSEAVPAGNKSIPVDAGVESPTVRVTTNKAILNPETAPADGRNKTTALLTPGKNKPREVAQSEKRNRQTNNNPTATGVTPTNEIIPPITTAGTGNANPVTDKTNAVATQQPAATNVVAGEAVPAVAAEKKNTEEKTETPVAGAAAKATKVKKKNRGSLALSFSAGPDLSMIGLNKSGTVKPILGGGISYTFRNGLTLATGVYTARKVYTAAPQDYKFTTLPPNYRYLTEIYGDCNVLAIPVNLYWNFKSKKKGSFYAGTGLTSLLMKKERYDYVYTYPSGTSYTYVGKHSNENKHLFSILNLSAGYRHAIGRKAFVAAEPYLQVPLNSGVGAGKVKLNSAGVLFTVGIKLF